MEPHQAPITTNYIKKKIICPRCEQLNLTVDRFIIGKDPANISWNSRNPYRALVQQDTMATASLFLNSASSKQLLGTLDEIQTRFTEYNCPFCSLVKESVSSRSGRTSSDGAKRLARCFITWEIDGRTVQRTNDHHRSRTRRIHLQWEDELFEDCCLALMAPQGPQLLHSDAHNIWRNDSHFLGRKTTTQGKITLLKSWLDECLRSHAVKCGHNVTSGFADVMAESNFGVIDVVDMCLTSLPSASEEPGFEPGLVNKPPVTPQGDVRTSRL